MRNWMKEKLVPKFFSTRQCSENFIKLIFSSFTVVVQRICSVFSLSVPKTSSSQTTTAIADMYGSLFNVLIFFKYIAYLIQHICVYLTTKASVSVQFSEIKSSLRILPIWSTAKTKQKIT